MALRRRSGIPVYSLLFILDNTKPATVCYTKIKLRLGIPLFRLLSPQSHHSGVVPVKTAFFRAIIGTGIQPLSGINACRRSFQARIVKHFQASLSAIFVFRFSARAPRMQSALEARLSERRPDKSSYVGHSTRFTRFETNIYGVYTYVNI